ncbi:hypothetical protein D3C86_2042910 [compost metagenome]
MFEKPGLGLQVIPDDQGFLEILVASRVRYRVLGQPGLRSGETFDACQRLVLFQA